MTANKAAQSMSWVPRLEGWVSLPEAGARLRVSRQLMFQMAQGHQLKSLRLLPGAGKRPAAYVISEAEMTRLLKEQAERAERVKPAETVPAVA